ncbi:MAG: spermidine/putrescine ABC transporter permease PotB [Desulfovibrionaceae bacterium]
MKETSLFRRISIGGAALWLILFAVLPFLLVAGTSLLVRDETTFVRLAFSLEGFRGVFGPVFLKVLWQSLYLASGTTLICLLVGYPFAYVLARWNGPRRSLLLLLVIIPFWTNSLLRTYAMVFLLKGNGLFSKTLMWLGLADKPVSLLYTETAIFIGLVYTLLPFMILPLYASIEKMDGRLLEAARDLGANRFKAFMNVTVPLSLPGIIAGSMMVFLPALGMFYIPDLLGGGKHIIAGNFIKDQFLIARDWPLGSAASVVLTLLMALLLLAYNVSSRRVHRDPVQEADGA